MAAGLELSKRAMEAPSLDALYLLLTNDVRSVLEFDRCFLFTHMGGASALAAAGNQPTLEKKSAFYDRLNALAAQVKDLNKPLLLSNQTDVDKITPEMLRPDIKAAVLDFMDFSKATAVFVAPLKSDNEVIGHLFFEFLSGSMPDQLSVVNMLNLCTLFGGALAKRWALSRSPHLVPLTESSSWAKRYLPAHAFPRIKLALAIIGLVALAVFFLPIPFNVGGDAEVVARHRHMAFCQVDGIVEQILVTEGAKVAKGQVVALLDPTELHHKIALARRQIDFLKNEADILQRSSFENVAKLSESQMSALKLKRGLAELDYLRWQVQFLEIKSPADGIVLTKQIETQAGKKFKAGEPFCEIASPEDLCVEVQVPEDRMAYVEKGQAAALYLNSDPARKYDLRVDELAPRSEAIPRTGNIYRVRASFTAAVPRFSVGQKGTGSIYEGTRTLWFIMHQRVAARWNEFSHRLW
jgi:multidrug resistance efflux pump